MVTEQLYYDIAKKYGKVASWAVWAKVGNKPKSNISDMDIFDVKKTPSTLEILRTDIVMVALNFAREVEIHEPFSNFHDSNPHGQDYKIRFAFECTNFYGAYMTDIIKDFPMLSSKDVLKHIKDKPHEVAKQVEGFREELRFIGSYKPTILAFGKDTFNILNKNMDESEYSNLISITHYSHQISKENYRIDSLKKLGICNDKNPNKASQRNSR
ncbi:MAG: hypothetical protein HN687_05630 [Candidatus Marinimicrobia bacterium]|jgi:hypothetical protein|nr:hypothetical protein [Candidatus Neomarinimicrobiota bacterium]MBT7973613.1 hypothetical protein [Candidatus Neomarinimicrobiota bacterium]